MSHSDVYAYESHCKMMNSIRLRHGTKTGTHSGGWSSFGPQKLPDVSNRSFAKHDAWFKKCCDAACVKQTSRQASKFRRGMGAAASM